jgi:predicted DCC family thiol-disulfide oxidoreductase YuxK
LNAAGARAQPLRPQQAATLFYDSDCGICRWTVAKVAAWDRRGAIRLVPLQDRITADRMLGPMTEETRMASWHLVGADGRVRSAGRGVAPLLRLLPGGPPAARIADMAPAATDALYRFVAGHRSELGRLLTRGARERAERRLRRRAQ